MGDKYLYLTYYVHLVGIKEVIDCNNARSGKLQIDDNRNSERQSDRRLTKSSIFQHTSEKQASGRLSNISSTY
jgi:hypothetical protein